MHLHGSASRHWHCRVGSVTVTTHLILIHSHNTVVAHSESILQHSRMTSLDVIAVPVRGQKDLGCSSGTRILG